MAILLNPWTRPEDWRDRFAGLLPDHPVQIWPDIVDPGAIRFAVIGTHDAEDLHRYPNLQAILTLSAGIEHLDLAAMPEVPIVRLHDQAMSNEMAAFVTYWILRFHRRFGEYAALQAERTWKLLRGARARRFPVGVLGMGTIGRTVGSALAVFDYPVNGWSRSPRTVEGVEMFAGLDRLPAFLGASQAVVNVLPNTPATRGLMDGERFAAMPEGAVYISIGRGATTNEPDLLDALDRNHLRAAVLDVVETEPLPADSPLWSHPAVHVTPHTSGLTSLRTSAEAVADNILRIERGETPGPVVDRSLGY